VQCVDGHETLIVAVGDIELPAVMDVCVARVRADIPSAEVLQAVGTHVRTVVAEEGDPLVEGRLGAVTGRATGHLPYSGRITPSMVLDAIDGFRADEPPITTRPDDPLPVDASLFTAIARLRRDGVFVATDVGSSVALSYAPFDGAHTALALGSSAAVAAGAARTGRQCIAVLGDFGLLHSGITALVEIAGAQLPVVTIVIENGIQAKTGNQPLPAVDLDAILRDGGLGRTVVWDLASPDPDDLYERLASEVARRAPVVVRYRRSS
jgi:indolepyruvate ferredoxin oxidoreductase alpha subunit